MVEEAEQISGGVGVPDPAPPDPPHVLLITAGMGAGHNGVARELARRLDAHGCETSTVDFLDALPGRLGPAMRAFYRAQLRHAPWSYDAMYRLRFRFSSAWSGINAFYTRLTRRTILDWIDAYEADVVVSLYPLAGTVLAELRGRGQVSVPVTTFITDFGVHPLWVHEAADRHLCVHELAAFEAVKRCGSPASAPGPLVASVPLQRAALRAQHRGAIGVGDEDFMVVVSGGSWALGEIVKTVEELVAARRFVPVVLCGSDEKLRARVQRAGGVGLAWIDDVPGLLIAADALVDNAGGLTCMEAFAVGTPVISYRPIAGHGRHNAGEMRRAGVSRYPRSAYGLVATLDLLRAASPLRDEMIGAGDLMFAGDAAKDVIDLAREGRSLRRESA